MFLAYAVASTLLIAPPTDAGVKRAITKYEALDYRGAVTELRRSLAKGELSRADRLIALKTLAPTLAILEQPRRSQRRFEELLQLEPTFEVSWEESERVRKAYTAARATHEARVKARKRVASREQRGPRRWTDRSPNAPARPLSEPTLALDAEVPPPAPESGRWWLVGVIAGSAVLAAGMITLVAVKLAPNSDVDNVDGVWQLP